jgi:hypothetical protein
VFWSGVDRRSPIFVDLDALFRQLDQKPAEPAQ